MGIILFIVLSGIAIRALFKGEILISKKRKVTGKNARVIGVLFLIAAITRLMPFDFWNLAVLGLCVLISAWLAFFSKATPISKGAPIETLWPVSSPHAKKCLRLGILSLVLLPLAPLAILHGIKGFREMRNTGAGKTAMFVGMNLASLASGFLVFLTFVIFKSLLI